MPSLDGYSLNEEIKKLRKEVFQELAKQREAFSELYRYLSRMEEDKKKEEAAKTTKKKFIKKEVASA